MPELHRVPEKQLDEKVYTVDDDMSRIEGLSRTTAEVEAHLDPTGHVGYDHAADESRYDTASTPLTQQNLQDALDEFSSMFLAVPVRETSAAVVGASYYQLTAAEDVWVSDTPGKDPNTLVGLYDEDGDELVGITVTDITSDQAGTTTVIGNSWHNQPYVQLSGVPGVKVMFKYGIKGQLAALPTDTLLREGVIVAEVDSDVIAAIAAIKGTAWDAPVPTGRSLDELGDRVDALEIGDPFKFNVTPTGTQDGTNAVFTLPGTDEYQTGTLKVYLNGIKLKDSKVQKDSSTQLTLLVETEQLPDSSIGDYIEIDYVNIGS